MNYSKIHAHVAEYDAIDRDEILNEPQNYFGPNYQTVLNFWWFVESLQEVHLSKVTELYDEEFQISGWKEESRVLNNVEERIDLDFLSSAIGDSILEEIPHPEYSIRQSRHGAIFNATCELIAMDIIFERGGTLVYVPMFDDIKEDVPPQTGKNHCPEIPVQSLHNFGSFVQVYNSTQTIIFPEDAFTELLINGRVYFQHWN